MSLASVDSLNNTAAFINENSIVVTLYRRARTADGVGGTQLGVRQPVGQMTGRLVGRRPSTAGSTAEGSTNQSEMQYTLVTMPSEDVQIGDDFDLVEPDGSTVRYTVEALSVSPPWRRSAELKRATL